jgi:hypothetical protein
MWKKRRKAYFSTTAHYGDGGYGWIMESVVALGLLENLIREDSENNEVACQMLFLSIKSFVAYQCV